MVAADKDLVNPAEAKSELRAALWGESPRTDNRMMLGFLVGVMPGRNVTEGATTATPPAARVTRRRWLDLVDVEWLRLAPLLAFGGSWWFGVPARHGVPAGVSALIDRVNGGLHDLSRQLASWPEDGYGAPVANLEDVLGDASEITELASVLTMVDPALMPPDYAAVASEIRGLRGEYPNDFHGRIEELLYAMCDAYYAITGEERFAYSDGGDR